MTPQERAKAVRARLMRPPNAVIDKGIDLHRMPPGMRYITPTLMPLPLPPKRVIKGRTSLVTAILDTVAGHFNLGILDLTGPSRTPRCSRARHLAAHLIMEKTTLSSSAVGKILNRDHSSILYGKNKIRGLMESNPTMKAMVDDIENLI